MPETAKGKKIRKALRKQYGKNADRVFYAGINKGRFLGTHRKGSKWEKRAERGRRLRGKKVYVNSRTGKRTLTRKHKQKISKGLRKYHARKR